MNKKYDIGIIGSGPAGYTAAIRASQLGKSVILFEKEHLGGTCLNKGCIPTKVFLHTADVYNSIKKASTIGIEVENCSVNFEKVAERKDKTVEKIRKSLEMLLKSYNIEIVKAEAEIVDSGIIKSGEEQYECKHTLVATGSSPKCVGGYEFDHQFILSSDDVLELKSLPKKVLIAGSGAIGVEWARILSSFGSEVAIVEIADRLLPLADYEISARLERTLKMARVKMFLSTSVKEIKDNKVELSNGEVMEPDFVLFATGRAPLTPNLSPAKGEWNKDFAQKIHLIGDVFGETQLAHFASHQAVSVVENLIFNKTKKDFLVPSVVYGEPEIAWVGETEQELIRKNIGFKKSVFPVPALGKAHCDNNLEGFIKVLSVNDKIVGAHIISKEASAMIHQFLIAMQNGLSIEELTQCCFAHPTYSEGVYEALLGLDNESLALLKAKSE